MGREGLFNAIAVNKEVSERWRSSSTIRAVVVVPYDATPAPPRYASVGREKTTILHPDGRLTPSLHEHEHAWRRRRKEEEERGGGKRRRKEEEGGGLERLSERIQCARCLLNH